MEWTSEIKLPWEIDFVYCGGVLSNKQSDFCLIWLYEVEPLYEEWFFSYLSTAIAVRVKVDI